MTDAFDKWWHKKSPELVSGDWDDDRAIAQAAWEAALRLSAGADDTARLDYIERTFSGMTNSERYLPVRMHWGKSANGRTLREACDKYMKRDAAPRHETGED